MDDPTPRKIWLPVTLILYATLVGINFFPSSQERILEFFQFRAVGGMHPVLFVVLIESLAFLPCFWGFYHFVEVFEQAQGAGVKFGHGLIGFIQLIGFVYRNRHLRASLAIGFAGLAWFLVVGFTWASLFAPAQE